MRSRNDMSFQENKNTVNQTQIVKINTQRDSRVDARDFITSNSM